MNIIMIYDTIVSFIISHSEQISGKSEFKRCHVVLNLQICQKKKRQRILNEEGLNLRIPTSRESQRLHNNSCC